MQCFEFLISWQRKNKKKSGNRRNKKGKILLFNEIDKGCVLDKSRKLIIEVVNNSYKGIFYFFDNLKKFHEIFSCKVYLVNYIMPVFN